MFVQEEKIFAGKVLRLHICAADGAEWLEEATEDTSVEKLKERCLKHVRRGAADPRPGPTPTRAPTRAPAPALRPCPPRRGQRRRPLSSGPSFPARKPLDAILSPAGRWASAGLQASAVGVTRT